ncbi:MAG: ATP-binding protein [Planctomycetota bacterium]|jgi:DNA-binding NarL/FixJ family response regulator
MGEESAAVEQKVLHILIVDDDEQCCRIFGEVFSLNPEFSAEVVSSAEEAQEILKNSKFAFDLCLIDLVLPGIQGEELLRWIKSHAIQMPVVMLSGHREEEQLMRCLRGGAIEFIQKPIKSEDLFKVLRHAVDRQGQINEEAGDIQAVSPSGSWVELTAPSEMEYLARMQRFTEVLLASHCNDKICEDLRLAIEEFGRNAIEWGNKFDRSKCFHISYCIFDDRIIFKFEDEGEGFKPSALPDPSKDPKAHILRRKEEGKRPGGFGVHLVQKIMDEVTYSERGNVVLMTKFLSQ